MPAVVEHVEVSNPDDAREIPIYGGPLADAGTMLIPGEYSAYVHFTNGDEGYRTLTVSDDNTATIEEHKP